jgi:DnaJ-class molecular chaperone
VANDPYVELGVTRAASDADIQKAFRKLAKELHPDQNKGNKATEERFKRITAAYDFLKDADKRKRFDRGEIDADGREIYRGFGGGAGGASPGGFGGGTSGRFEGMDFEDIFDMFGAGGRRGAGGPAGAGGFGGSPFGSAPPAKGNDVKIKLDIDLLDTIVGNTRRVLFSDGRTVDVNIPKCARDGQMLRLKGQGSPAPGGRGSPGDAMIELRVKEHPIFRLEGNDLHMDLFVSLPDAVLGGKVQAPTPDGPVSVNIAAGTNSGGVLRLKGRGAFHKDNERGDLFAHIAIALPDGQLEKMPDGIRKDLTALAERWRAEAPYAPSMRRK